MKIHFASALRRHWFCRGQYDFILRASAFTWATSPKTSTRSKLVRWLALLHISTRTRSIICTIQFRNLKHHQYKFKVRCHLLFVAAQVMVITIRFTRKIIDLVRKARCYQFGCNQGCVYSSCEVDSIQFIKKFSCRLNYFIKS